MEKNDLVEALWEARLYLYELIDALAEKAKRELQAEHGVHPCIVVQAAPSPIAAAGKPHGVNSFCSTYSYERDALRDDPKITYHVSEASRLLNRINSSDLR